MSVIGWVGNLVWEGKGPFTDALCNQSRMNANGASAAAIAALLQGLSIGVKVIGPLLGLS